MAFRPPCGHRNSLRVRQRYTLNVKLVLAKTTIQQWHRYWRGDVFIDCRGTDASRVLVHLVRSIYPQVPASPLESNHPYVDTMILDDPVLTDEFDRHGNNTPFSSKPLATWLESDIEEYLKRFKL